MSRIGKMPISVPNGTSVTIGSDEATVTVKGPKGQLSRTLPKVSIVETNGTLVLASTGQSKAHRACHGLSRALLANMIVGVSTGHRRTLVIIGTGYKAELAGNKVTLSLGFSHPVIHTLPKGITAAVDKKGVTLDLECADKELLGLHASQIRGYRPPEPYKGKGVAYSDEVIRRKAGKTGK